MESASRRRQGIVEQDEVRRQQMLYRRVRQLLGDHATDVEVRHLCRQVQLDRVQESNERILDRLDDLPAADEGRMPQKFPIEMSHNVSADTQRSSPNEVTRTPSKDLPVELHGITLGWPDGADNLVGIQIVSASGLKLVPRNPEDQYLAFNDFTETFPLNVRLNPDEDIVAKTVNLDTSNAHFVNIVPHIEELPHHMAPEDNREIFGPDEGGED